MRSIRTPSSDIIPWEGSIWLDFDFNMLEDTEGEILMLIFGGLHERHAV
jgi:hypothetical protein